MTVFVASLFLPYTVHFDSNHDRVRVEDVKRPENTERAEPVGYFDIAPPIASVAQRASTIPLTPGATTDTEKIFIPENLGTTFKPRLPSSNSATNLRSLIRPDVHSPSWGANIGGKQPKSRAKSPPPASILRHSVTLPITPVNGGSLRKQRKHRRAPSSSIQDFSRSEFTVDLGVLGNGGLVSAVDAASDNGVLDDKTWVGTLGMPTDAIHEQTKSNISERLESDFESLVVWTNDNDLNGHYEHYCKTILWPVLHYQIPDHPKSKAYEDHSWIFYEHVNQAFADRIVKNWKRGDVLWVHDYHLLLVPGMVRKQLPDAEIGVYLHTAFPSSEIFRCLAARSELMAGMLGSNMIGFQTEEYVLHFLQTCSRLMNVEATKQGIILEDGRLVHVDKYPIGIDPATIDHRRQHPDVKKWITTISEKYAGKRLIVARDKLDNVRGVRQKLLAYELFLNRCPQYRDQVVLIQIATSTTEDDHLSSAIADIATRINSMHSTLAHQPLVFLKQDINYSQWLALLMVADSLIVTSLREGMNLTGHEFIYCQDGKFGPAKHSPLIISEFTGSASLLKESALLINPWDYKSCADSIRVALEMSADEKEARWLKMYEAVTTHDAANWYKSYRKGLDHAYKDHALRDATAVPRLSQNVVLKKYKSASSRLLILDYEGTLAAWGSPTDIVITTPKKALDVLSDLVEDKKNIVYVMSSRRPDEMERLFKLAPGIGMIAENGAYLLEVGSTEWSSLVDADHIADWKDGVRSILKYYEERIEKSRIEEFDSALLFNYAGTADKQAAFRQAGECANHINDACLSLKVHALPVDDGLCIASTEVNKSSATTLIGDKLVKMSTGKGASLPDFLMVIGDSREDEYVFEWAHGMEKKGIRDVVTVTVGQRNTAASCTLTQGVTGVLSTLQKLAGQTPYHPKMLSPNSMSVKRSE